MTTDIILLDNKIDESEGEVKSQLPIYKSFFEGIISDFLLGIRRDLLFLLCTGILCLREGLRFSKIVASSVTPSESSKSAAASSNLMTDARRFSGVVSGGRARKMH